MLKSTLLLSFTTLLLITNVNIIQADDFVPQFPWWGPYSFKAYSGMLDISQDQSIHYVFLESNNTPATDPIVVWLNGGPGCSSMLGLIQEIGPYRMEGESTNFTKQINQWAWNMNASVLYIESPPGVGFSTNNDKQYKYNDNNTARDNYLALQQFYQRYPQYVNNKLWITGESYAGMYIPYLTQYIIQQNVNVVAPNVKINLVGIMVGNGVMINDQNFIDNVTDTFYNSHMFLSPDLNNIFLTDCQKNPQGVRCRYYKYQRDLIIKRFPRDYIYGYCFGTDFTFEQCADFKGINNYFDDPYVQQQLHVTPRDKWFGCNNTIQQLYQQDSGSINIYPFIMQNGIKIIQYSGNVDSIIPEEYTLQSIQKLLNITKGTLVSDWQTIILPNNQVGGFTASWTNITFVQILGAGHEVPEHKPYAAYYMLMNALQS